MRKFVCLALMPLVLSGTAHAHQNAPRVSVEAATARLKLDPLVVAAKCAPAPGEGFVVRNHVRLYRHVACRVTQASGFSTRRERTPGGSQPETVTGCFLYHAMTPTAPLKKGYVLRPIGSCVQ